jgi:hypothetical protein
VDEVCWACAKETPITDELPAKRYTVVGKRAGKMQALLDEAVAQRTREIVAEVREAATELLHSRNSTKHIAGKRLDQIADAIEERYK